MSFGIGIGDFIKVVEVADKIVSRCKAATLEFRDLSRDVVSMQIVLDAVRKYWEQQKLNGRDLSDSQKENLQELTHNCQEVLDDIGGLLQKHGGLEAGTGLLNRIKWLRAGDLGPLRMRLLARTMYLAEFNRNIVAFNTNDPQFGSQAVVLNALNVVNYRYHIGRRGAPAFSQATAADLEQESTWKDINEDLEKEGVDPLAIASEKPFIKRWIDDVILAEDTVLADETPADDESVYSIQPPLTSVGGQDRRSSYTGSISTSPINPRAPTRIDTDRTLVDKSPTVKHVELVQTRSRDTRQSISSERRRSSDQKPRNQQIQANLDSLFRMGPGADKDLVDKLLEHVFLQLDTTKRGIFPDYLEKVLLPVLAKAKHTAKQKALDIIEAEAIPGSRMNQATFTGIISQILENLHTPEKPAADVKTTEETSPSRDAYNMANRLAYHWLMASASNENIQSLLPYGWEVETAGVGTKFFYYVPQNITCHRTMLPSMPISAIGTFANMFWLSKRCRSELDMVQDLWQAHEELDEQYLQSSLELIEDVREAAHRFEVFNLRKTSAATASLDDILGQADIVDMADVAMLGPGNALPVQQLRNLQQSALQSLQSILIFLIELSTEEFQEHIRDYGKLLMDTRNGNRLEIRYNSEPPSPGQSRVNMEHQAAQILTDAASWWESSTNTIKTCRSFAITDSQLAARAKEALGGSKRLHLQSKRCRHLVVPRPLDLPEDKFVILRLDRLEDLPKGNKFFRAGPPDIQALVYIDNIRLTKSKKAAYPTQISPGRDVYLWNDAEPYHISIGTSSTLYVHIHNTKRRDRDDEGFMGLLSIDVSKLPTSLDCNATSLQLSNSFLKPGVRAGTITLKAHWCPLSQFVRANQNAMAKTWARKDTADDRFYFEDLERDEQRAGSRTAIFDRRGDGLLGG